MYFLLFLHRKSFRILKFWHICLFWMKLHYKEHCTGLLECLYQLYSDFEMLDIDVSDKSAPALHTELTLAQRIYNLSSPTQGS